MPPCSSYCFCETAVSLEVGKGESEGECHHFSEMLKRGGLHIYRAFAKQAGAPSVLSLQGHTRHLAESATSIGIQANAVPASAEARLLRAVSRAREAISVAKDDDSDDPERDKSVTLSRHAIKLYEERLSVLESADNVDARKEFDTKVGGEVALLKEELFASRKPRVWMVHSGWF